MNKYTTQEIEIIRHALEVAEDESKISEEQFHIALAWLNKFSAMLEKVIL